MPYSGNKAPTALSNPKIGQAMSVDTGRWWPVDLPGLYSIPYTEKQPVPPTS